MHTFGSYVKEIQMTCCSQNRGGKTDLKQLFRAAQNTIQHRLDQAKKYIPIRRRNHKNF